MKLLQLNSTITITALASALLFTSVPTSHAQPQLTSAQVSSLTAPLNPDAVPKSGTFWLLKGPWQNPDDRPFSGPPLPCPPGDLPDVPIYSLGNGQFLVDDSQVDYQALQQQQRQMSLAAGIPFPGDGDGGTNYDYNGGTFTPMFRSYTSNDLWLEIVAMTNYTGAFVVHPPYDEITNGVYDLYMTTNLSKDVPGLNLTNWMYLLRTDPGQTNLIVPDLYVDMAFFMLGRTNDADGDGMPDAYEHLVSHTDPNHADAPVILVQPFSQEVDQGDTVTFSVIAEGAPSLSYQWFLGGTAVTGETNSSLTYPSADPSQQGDYSVQVSSPVGLSVLSSNATLTVDPANNWPLVTVTGPRYNYTFKNGVTYYVGSRSELYGLTTIEGGAIIKADWYYTNSTLAIMGTLVCKTDDQYSPAFFTSVDDDTVGDAFYYSSGSPATANNGAPYIDLTSAQDLRPSLNNLRVRYADQGIVSAASKYVDVWDSQFLQCNSAVVAAQDSTVAFHNVLVGGCGTVVAGSTNFAAITGEHLTADVTNFWTQIQPNQISLVNSIVVGSIGTGPILAVDHTAINPATPVFQSVGSGNYYLTNTSSYRGTGSTSVSPRLLTEFHNKSTQPPIAFPAFSQVVGDMALAPQAARYTNGAPDYGFYYPALDYTVAWMTNWGTITILRGTAIGFRNEYSSSAGRWTWWGFDLHEGSSFVSQGTPDKPNVFTDVQLVQEQPASPCISSFVPDFWPNDLDLPAPYMVFRFSHFYANPHWYHFWSGLDASYGYLYSPDSLVNWNLQDCALHGGRITLGEPDDGSWYGAAYDWVYGTGGISWVNNLFDGVAIDLDPTFYEYGADDQGLNCDMSLVAYNNLFRGGLWFHIEPIPATAGNWVFQDNLFDKVDFIQDTNSPMDFSYNGYWPLTASELGWDWNFYPWYSANSGQLSPSSSGGGGNEQVLASAPPYQTGPLGDYYLPTGTLLYHAGSRSAADAGMFHYTTRVDQIKEGEELSGASHMVNIGVHYVATTGSGSTQPKDYDGDNIPDYVENASGTGTMGGNETDWQTAYTVAGVWDPTNTVYDSIDLSGNGLVGRVKKVLQMGPFDTGNPLVPTRIFTGAEPDLATFNVPVGYDVLTNGGQLKLVLDGTVASFQDFYRATNGNCLLVWNTTYALPGAHNLQVQVALNGQFQQGASPDTRVLTGNGPMAPFYSANVCQFDAFYSQYDSNGAILYAQLPCPEANYTIELRTPAGAHIRTITNSTSTGIIKETWDLTDDNSNVYSGDTADAVFHVTLLDPADGTNVLRIHNSDTVQDGAFIIAYTWDNTAEATGVMWDAVQGGIVDPFIQPTSVSGIDDDPYDYDPGWNDYTWWGDLNGDPGYMPNQASADSLRTNHLVQATARNFFFAGHGNPDEIGDGDRNQLVIGRGLIAARLHNKYDSTNGAWNGHPFRFVFLDACDTADNPDWAHAFGICTKITSDELADKPDRVQAFLGWNGEPRAPVGNEWNDEALTYAVFSNYWMSRHSLHSCIYVASQKHPLGDPSTTLNFPLGKKFDYWHSGFLGSNNKFHLRIYGYAGVCREGYISGIFDDSQYYK
jgi:hypothetical protein